MVGKIDAGDTLTARYKRLKERILEAGDEGAASRELERNLDEIYRRIVDSPVVDLGGAAEKLDFAHHCLIDEEDLKEAANLVLSVRRALLQLSAIAPEATCPVILRKRSSQQVCRSPHPSAGKPVTPASVRVATGGKVRRVFP